MKGTVVLHNSRSRVLNFFTPPNFSPSKFRELVNMMGRADEKNGYFGSLEEYEYYLPELTDYTLLPIQQLKKLFEERKGSIGPIPKETVVSSLMFGYEKIHPLSNGYSRQINDDKIEIFDMDGRLIRIKDQNKNWIEIQYKKNLIDRIVNNNGHFFIFEYNDKDLVKKIQANNGRYATYEYDRAGQLIKATNSKGEEIHYHYRNDGSGYLTSVVFPDQRSIQISYSKHENYIQSLKRCNGSVTTYEYHNINFPDKRKSILKVNVNHKTNIDKKPHNKYEIEYYFIKDGLGINRLEKEIKKMDSKVSEIIYVKNSRFLPLIKTENGIATHFKYDNLWRRVKEESLNNIIESLGVVFPAACGVKWMCERIHS
jgi:YD repeat-containing protein